MNWFRYYVQNTGKQAGREGRKEEEEEEKEEEER